MTDDRPPEPTASDLRLAALAAATSSVLWHTAPDGSVDADNLSWQAFTGQPPQGYRGWGWLDAVHDEDRPGVLAAWLAALATGDRFDVAYRLRRHDGVFRHMAAQGAPVLHGGAVREWVGIAIDVTDRREAQNELRQSEERLRLLDKLGQATRALTDAAQVMAVTARMLGEHLGASRCAYADVDADNDRFTIRNDWAAAGMSSSAGVYSLDLFGPQATSNLRNGRNLVLRDVDRELGDEGGGRMFNAIRIKAIITAPLVKAGRLVAMMAVHQSAPRAWTEHEIALVEEVVDRCWAHIERVRDAAMLREQDRHKDEFLATLAHELRNPLAPMRYATTMMRLSPDPASTTQARDIIDRQVGQMARLIDDLLDLSRVNRGLITLQRQPVGLNSLLEQALEAARPAMEAARHRLQVQLPADDLALDADPARVVQMVANLLDNAAKYTPEGGQIRLAAWPDGGNAVIQVVDNGIGIPPDQQGRLFQMFTQLHHTAKRAKGGLGIGLALVKTLAQMHGGAVRVHSLGLDEGASFTVELPLAEAAEAPAAAPGAPTAGDAASPDARVLVVEDNADGREALVGLLSMLGYSVAAAASGPDGVREAQRFRPHIVLLDLGLPGFDGYEVARRIRADADPTVARAVLVALTGWGAAQDRERTSQAHFDAHLTKPVEAEVLAERLLALAAAAGVASMPGQGAG